MSKPYAFAYQMSALADFACDSSDPREADLAAAAVLQSPPADMRDATAIVHAASVALEWLQLGGLPEAERMVWYCRIRQGLDASLPILKGAQGVC